MTIMTDSTTRSAALLRERERADSYAMFALVISFGLAMLGLLVTTHPRPDVETVLAFTAMFAN